MLILDEPTAVLTPQEIDDLIRVMGELRQAGTSIVFITHKLREVKAIADRITVIRRGKVVGEAPVDASEEELATMMVGRAVQPDRRQAAARPGAVAWVQRLTVADDRGQVTVDGSTSTVRAARSWRWPGCRATARRNWSRPCSGCAPASGSIMLEGRNWSGGRRTRCSTPASGSSPRTASTTA